MVMMSLTTPIFASYRNAKIYLLVEVLHGLTRHQTLLPALGSGATLTTTSLFLKVSVHGENTELETVGNRQLKPCCDSQNPSLIVTPTTHFISSI